MGFSSCGSLAVLVLLLGPIGAGFATVVGSALNGETNRMLESLMWSVAISTWMSFCISTMIGIFAPAPAFVPNFKRAVADTRKQPSLIPMWFQSPLMLTFLFLGAWLPEYIGLGIFYVVVIFCQILGSLIFDITGFFWTVKRPVFWQGWLGGLLVLVGSGVFQLQEFSGQSSISGGPFFGYVCLAAVAGISSMIVPLLAIRLASYIGPFRATSYAYAMGGTIMGFALLVSWTQPASGVQPDDWWKFFGGAFGMTNILLNVIFARKLGFAIHYSTVTAGQLTMSLLMDSIGFAGLDVIPISVSRVGGVLVVICGVGFFAWNKIKGNDLEVELESSEDETKSTRPVSDEEISVGKVIEIECQESV